MAHAMEATRGQREVFGLYRESMHEPGSGPDGRSPFQIAKAAAEDRGEHIFAKPDHLGIQVLSKTVDAEKALCQSMTVMVDRRVPVAYSGRKRRCDCTCAGLQPGGNELQAAARQAEGQGHSAAECVRM